MRLSELHPAWEDHGGYLYLAFDCPKCQKHRIEIPTPPHPKAWHFQDTVNIRELNPFPSEKDFLTITLSPSIAHTCHDADGFGSNLEGDKEPRVCESHFFITDGGIIPA